MLRDPGLISALLIHILIKTGRPSLGQYAAYSRNRLYPSGLALEPDQYFVAVNNDRDPALPI